jgi:hypothetical protein
MDSSIKFLTRVYISFSVAQHDVAHHSAFSQSSSARERSVVALCGCNLHSTKPSDIFLELNRYRSVIVILNNPTTSRVHNTYLETYSVFLYHYIFLTSPLCIHVKYFVKRTHNTTGHPTKWPPRFSVVSTVFVRMLGAVKCTGACRGWETNCRCCNR